MQDNTAADHTAPPSAPSASTVSLDPRDWAAFREQAHRMLDDMLGFAESIREHPVWQVIPDEVRARFREELPQTPTALGEVHQEFLRSILPFGGGNAHPGFMGWVQGGGTPVGMLAEMLAAGLNANVGGRDQIPLEVERQVTHWMRTLFGFPAEASGLFLSGSSMANWVAIKVARDARLGSAVRREGVGPQHEGPEHQNTRPRLVAYTSAAAHGSLARAFDFCGLGSDALRHVPVDDRHRMDLDALARTIAADRAAGLTPFLVAATAGTVDTGAIDDLAAIAELCAQQRLWFHVDGALGALAMLAPELAPRLHGIERADSLAFDFHKWGQVPYDAGFLLVRDGELHRQAFATSSAYLTREERGLAAGSPWPCDFGPELSRSFRALKTWTTLKVYGAAAIGAVIRHSCELARYLEAGIASQPELELLAPVELNIVCFRYRFEAQSTAAGEDLANRLNRQLIVALQESGAVAPSLTMLDGRAAIRAAIVNHRTTRAEIDTLLQAVLETGRSLRKTVPSAEPTAPQNQATWKPWVNRSARLREIETSLDTKPEKPVEIALRFERATLLGQLGRKLEARSEHMKVIELDPNHLSNLIGLGLLLAGDGHRKAAQLVYAEGVKRHPESIVCRVNLGGVLLEGDDPAGARLQFEAALKINPEFPQAHAGMYYALIRLGEREAAAQHQSRGFGKKNFFINPYRGTAEPIPVVLFVSSTGGNTPLEKLIDDRVFQTYVVVTDFYDSRIPLPPHQLVINGIGDVEVAREALLAAEALLGRTSAPLLNPPAAILATGRSENATRLGELPGLIAPRTSLFSYAALAAPDAADALVRQGFTFPLLLRVPGFHMGKHFVQVESPEALAAAVAELPGADRPDAQLLAIEYLDARGADGCHRKFRVMMVDGQLFPLHLAISDHWKIHYFSADMADRPEHRAEEVRFLSDMAGFLGPKAMDALRRLQIELALDYAGIDFGLNSRGEILLFEANATMIVQQPDPGEHWDYRRPAVERIHAAVHHMFLKRAGHAGTACVPATVTITG